MGFLQLPRNKSRKMGKQGCHYYINTMTQFFIYLIGGVSYIDNFLTINIAIEYHIEDSPKCKYRTLITAKISPALIKEFFFQ